MARQRYLKNTRLKKTLDEYSKSMTAMINIKPKQYDADRIQHMIHSLPERKWHAAQGVITAVDEEGSISRQLKALRASKMLEASNPTNKDRLTNADDRKAFVENDPDVQAMEVDLINAKANLMAAKLAFECLDDLFTAGKKMMERLVDQERQVRQYDKYVKNKGE